MRPATMRNRPGRGASRALAPSVPLYRPRAAASLAVAEPPPDPMSEAELSLIWSGLRFPEGALLGPSGPVEVLNPGRRGGASGPDFRDAVVRVGGAVQRGDVELHVRASYFLQHGHHLDPAYDHLVLHVVFRDDAGGSTPLACGERVQVAAFEPWFSARATDLASWLRSPPLWQEPCRTAPARLGGEAVLDEVRRAGEARFRARSETLGAAIEGEGREEALWQALLEAFGYGGDRDGFRRLARALPGVLVAELAARHPGDEQGAIQAALLAVAGLAPAPELGTWLPPPLAPPLRNLASRPANRPERRLAGVAALAAGGRLAERAVNGVAAAGDGRALVTAWSRPALGVGRARATEVVLNAVLPFVAAVEPALAARCLELAASLAALTPYGKTAFLEGNLAPPERRRLSRSALEQQGLLALHASWCSQGGCGRCPLS